jgi:2-dehydropantoate 2-reductase
MQNSSLNVLVFGAGAIGTYIGGSLALAGHNLTFVEQPAVAESLRQRGLKLDLSVDKRRVERSVFEIRDVVIVDSLESALAGSCFDVAIFALKSFDTIPALESLKPFREALPPVLCLQNGVDNEPVIAEALGADKVIYGTVTSAVGRGGPGEITLEKLRGMGVAESSELSYRVAAALDGAFLNCQLFANAAEMKWSKLLTNLLANPTSAILDMTAAEIYAHPGLYQLEIEQLRECLAVMKAQGLGAVDLPGTPVRLLTLATRLPTWLSKPFLSRAAGAGRGAKMPSFHIDLYAGRTRSEVTYLHGAVVRAGEKLGVPTPVNKLLTETLLALAEKRLPLNTYVRQPEKLLAELKTFKP